METIRNHEILAVHSIIRLCQGHVQQIIMVKSSTVARSMTAGKPGLELAKLASLPNEVTSEGRDVASKLNQLEHRSRSS